MDMKHTPGPWEFVKSYKQDKNHWYAVVFTAQHTGKPHTPRAAEAQGITKDECDANARLIAAAPDLLSALMLYVGEPDEWADAQLTGRAQIARAAVAKAMQKIDA
jgi:hypothetical protein